MTVLLPETSEILRAARRGRPLFSNGVLADLFEQRHTRGHLKLLPRTIGGYIVYDDRRPVGDRTVATINGSEDEAHEVLERCAGENP